MKNIILVLLIIAVGAAIYMYALPSWNKIQMHQATLSEIDDLLAKVDGFDEAKNTAISRLNSVTHEQQARLSTMLPEEIDTEDLYIFFQALIIQTGMEFNGVTITKNDGAEPTISFSFKVEGSYSQLRSLLDSIENNLRIMDIVSIGLESGTEDVEFSITISGKMYYGR